MTSSNAPRLRRGLLWLSIAVMTVAGVLGVLDRSWATVGLAVASLGVAAVLLQSGANRPGGDPSRDGN